MFKVILLICANSMAPDACTTSSVPAAQQHALTELASSLTECQRENRALGALFGPYVVAGTYAKAVCEQQ